MLFFDGRTQELANGVQGVKLVKQRAGEVVIVRPGWVYAVVNGGGCILLDVKRYVPEAFPQYALSHVSVATQQFFNDLPCDCMKWPHVAASYVDRVLEIESLCRV